MKVIFINKNNNNTIKEYEQEELGYIPDPHDLITFDGVEYYASKRSYNIDKNELYYYIRRNN